jgi:predicted nuclease of predicted toxin-antitoxin system
VNLIADESVDRPIVNALRSAGYAVVEIAELAPSLTDDAVLALAQQHAAQLLTQDRDFGELVYRLGRASHGVLLIRLHGMTSAEKAVQTVNALRLHGERLPKRFAVLTRQGLRLRGLPAAN